MRRFNSGRVVNSLRRIDTLFTAQAMSPSPLSCPDLDLAGRGWRMPAEWEPHERTWMGWPERTDNWMQNARPAQAAFAAVATAIRRFEPVTVCASAAQVQRARAALPPEVEVVELAQGDAWFRDSGPTFVTWDELEDRAGTGEDGGVASGREESLRGVRARRVGGVDWKFNAWGGLYSPCEEDDAVAAGILKLAGSSSGAPCQRWRAPLVMEGGSIHVDGEGTLLTTAECLLHRNRNPELSKALIEGWLAKLLNVQTFIWLPNGLEADEDTNGHVDNMACFAAPGLVLLSWTDDDKDPQYARSLAALRILEAARDAKGRALRVLKLPLPPPLAYAPEEVEPQMEQGRAAGKRLAASYANFYICNGGVVAPAFGCPEADERARRVLEEAFPNRTVVSVPSRSILLGGGNIHCITQQQPKAWGHVDA